MDWKWFLEFCFGTPRSTIGTLIVISAIFAGLASIIRAFRKAPICNCNCEDCEDDD